MSHLACGEACWFATGRHSGFRSTARAPAAGAMGTLTDMLSKVFAGMIWSVVASVRLGWILIAWHPGRRTS